MTQEFHISVTPVRDDEYLIRTEHVAPGVPLADEQLVWPVRQWLEQARCLMNDPLVGVLQGNSPSRMGSTLSGNSSDPASPNDLSVSSLVELGRILYDALFQGRLRDSWMTAQGIAQHRGEVLRLRLGLKGPYLPRLPWEVLNGGSHHLYAGSSRPLATGTEILFSRYQPGMGMLGPIAHPIAPKPRQTLRLLMAIAAPTDQQQLELKQEAEHLQHELQLNADLLEDDAMVGTLPDIRVTILEQPGREQLAQALEQGNYQIFHFSGHSELGTAGGRLYLVNRHTGLSEPMSGDDLAGLLVNNGVQMAVFNSCRGAYTANMNSLTEASTGDRSLTEALVSQGVPAVLAMAEQIPDHVALNLTSLFYRNLKQDYPVDLSLSRARQGLLSSYTSQQLYWALPILYMHPEFDGYLTSGDRALDNPADSLMGGAHSLVTPPFVTPNSTQPNPAQLTFEPRDQRIEATDSSTTHEPTESASETAISEPVTDTPESPLQETLAADVETQEMAADTSAFDSDETAPAGASPFIQATEELQDIHESQDTETAIAAAIAAELHPQSQADLPAQGSAHDTSETPISDLGSDIEEDFFLPEDDLKVFDEGLATDEETAISEVGLDEDVSTWSLVEELEGSSHSSPSNLSDRQMDETPETAVSKNGRAVDGEIHSTDSLNHDEESSAELGNDESDIQDTVASEEQSGADWTTEESQNLDHQFLTERESFPISHSNPSVEDREEAPEQNGAASHSSDGLSNQVTNRHLQVVRSPSDLLDPKTASGDDEDVYASQRRSPRRNWKKVLLLPLAGVAGAAVVVLGYNLFPTLDSLESPTEMSQSTLNLEDLPQASTSDVVRFANTSFSQDDLSAGQAAVEELLKRGSVDEAKSALEKVPDDKISDPLITFLQGRLVWENLNKDKADAAIQDVSSYWVFAANQGDNPLYYNALGFAYYHQNRFHDAIEAWQSALTTLDGQGEAVVPSQTAGAEVSYSVDVPNGTLSNPDALTAYAGIALALAQLSVSTESQPYDALSRAIQIQQVVLRSDPAGFAPEALAQNWLWTDSTIQEWQILTQIRPQ